MQNHPKVPGAEHGHPASNRIRKLSVPGGRNERPHTPTASLVLVVNTPQADKAAGAVKAAGVAMVIHPVMAPEIVKARG